MYTRVGFILKMLKIYIHIGVDFQRYVEVFTTVGAF